MNLLYSEKEKGASLCPHRNKMEYVNQVYVIKLDRLHEADENAGQGKKLSQVREEYKHSQTEAVTTVPRVRDRDLGNEVVSRTCHG